jgi:DNA-binding GntR family transcriptional regulator
VADTPQWQQITDELRAKINDGTYAPGSTLPKQINIAAERGLSEATVAKAYRQLQVEGLITSIPRRGTIVNEPAAASVVTGGGRLRRVDATGVSLLGDESTANNRAEMMVPPADIAADLGLEPGQPAVLRSRVFLRGDVPIVVALSWYRPELLERIPLLDSPMPDHVHEMYPQAYGTRLAITHTRISARPIDPTERLAFDIEEADLAPWVLVQRTELTGAAGRIESVWIDINRPGIALEQGS